MQKQGPLNSTPRGSLKLSLGNSPNVAHFEMRLVSRVKLFELTSLDVDWFLRPEGPIHPESSTPRGITHCPMFA